jgi:phosphatidate cytidylyltransferase
MKRVITAAVLVPLVLLLLLKGSFFLVVLATAIVAGLAAWEYMSIAQIPSRILVLLSIAAVFAATYFDTSLIAPAIGLATIALFVSAGFRSPVDKVLPHAAYSIFGVLYCGLALATVPMIWRQPNGFSTLVFLFCVVWIGDTAALYVGRSFGRTKLAPQLSPNKSWEGSIASLVGGLLATTLLYLVGHGLQGPLFWWLGLAVILNIFAQVGDLVESAIKRGAGVKDSGAMLPGHGGILDRIDALLLAAPALWYALWVRQYFGWPHWS